MTVLTPKHPILLRYLLTKIGISFLVITFILSAIIIGNQIIQFLIKGQELGINDLGGFITASAVKWLPILLSFSLFLAILTTISNLYINTEMIAMRSLGVKNRYLWLYISPLVLIVSAIILYLQFYITPEAKFKAKLLKRIADKTELSTQIKPKTFHYFLDKQLVLYVDNVVNDNLLKQVFLRWQQDNQDVVIHATDGKLDYNGKLGVLHLILKDGTLYQNAAINSNEQMRVVNFKQYRVLLGDLAKKNINQIKNNIKKSVKTQTFTELITNPSKAQSIEIYYRLSNAIAIIILSLFAVLLMRAQPYQFNALQVIIIGIISFVLYYNLLSVAKKYMLSGGINIMWVHILFLLLSIALYFRQK